MSVIVFTENWDGAFKKVSFEIATYASKLAEMLNTDPIAISIGNVADEELKKLGNYGIKRVLSVSDDKLKHLDSQLYTKVIAEIAGKESAEVVVLANNNCGKALAPRLSVRLKASIASAVHELPQGVNPFVIKKRVFSGGAVAINELKTETKILTLAQNSIDIEENPQSAVIEAYSPELGDMVSAIDVKETEKQTGKVLLTDAEIVVSGGRGMKSPDNWAPLLEFAELLDGATACSRPVSDEGWRPHEEHTGQTGKIVAPNVYFAIGISGATQHLAGVSSSKYIIAINNDKDAPIFEAAQYGIVGDAAKILPQLVEAVKEMKSS